MNVTILLSMNGAGSVLSRLRIDSAISSLPLRLNPFYHL
jgi:hypothetical protein